MPESRVVLVFFEMQEPRIKTLALLKRFLAGLGLIRMFRDDGGRALLSTGNADFIREVQSYQIS